MGITFREVLVENSTAGLVSASLKRGWGGSVYCFNASIVSGTIESSQTGRKASLCSIVEVDLVVLHVEWATVGIV